LLNHDAQPVQQEQLLTRKWRILQYAPLAAQLCFGLGFELCRIQPDGV
jgi:hypothetical protein